MIAQIRAREIPSAVGAFLRGRTTIAPALPAAIEPADPRLLLRLAFAASILGGLGCAIGFIVLLGGWIGGSEFLKTPVNGSAPMRANTAIGLLLLGIAVCLERANGKTAWRKLGMACCAAVLCLGALTLFEFAAVNLHLDEVFFGDSSFNEPGDAVRGRMAMSTAFDFVILGCALLGVYGDRFITLAQLGAVFGAANCLLTLMAYIYGAATLYEPGSWTAMAPHTAIALILLSLAILLARPESGLMKTLVSRAPGGVLARRILPWAVLVPGVLGWLDWREESNGLYGTAFGHALFSFGRIVMLLFLIWLTSRILNRMGMSRDALKRHGEFLEEIVTARTAQLTEVNRELKEELQARRVAEEALRKSEERYVLAVSGANDGLWDWDLITNQIYLSPRWKTILGCGENEIGGHCSDWLNRIHPLDSDRVRAELAAHRNGESREFECEYRILHKDGAYRWVLSRGLAVRGPDGQATRLAGSQTDITQNKVSDTLTGLPNRILFADRLTMAIEKVRRNPARLFAVMFLDLDRFKDVNDSLGHLAGDQLLIGIGQRLRTSLRGCEAAPCQIDNWTVARLGGDEFAVLLPRLHAAEQAIGVADAILESLRQPFHIDGREVFSAASIGIAIGNSSYRAPDEVLRDADTALYVAKNKGKAQAAVFEASMGERAKARLDLGRDLRHALERREFFLEYQPIVLLRTGEVTGFEALLRWRHPERGLVAPSEFIPIAEETGLIISIGHWVLAEACRQMSSWNEQFPSNDFAGPRTIDVNLSGRQLVRDTLTAQVAAVLKQTGLIPRCLHLEITESILMEDTAAVVEILHELKGMGIGLTIDDFGTGYSSLSYLHRLPFDTLKIDRSFVESIGGGRGSSAIVKTIMNLSENLQMNVVAEGIENARQWSKLRALACTHGQGFYISQPLDAEAATQFIARTCWSFIPAETIMPGANFPPVVH